MINENLIRILYIKNWFNSRVYKNLIKFGSRLDFSYQKYTHIQLQFQWGVSINYEYSISLFNWYTRIWIWLLRHLLFITFTMQHGMETVIEVVELPVEWVDEGGAQVMVPTTHV